jgi:hypothetical protein
MSEETSSNEQGQQQELPAVEGGLPDVPPNPEATTEASHTEQTEPVYSSSAGEFKSVDELVRHTKDLERQIIEKHLGKEQPRDNTEVILDDDYRAKKIMSEEPALEDLILTDTKRAVEQIKKTVRDEMREENSANEARRQFYDDLYSKNPILQPYKDVVDLIVERNREELSKMTLLKAEEEIKKRTLKWVGAVAERTGGKLTETQVTGGSSEVLTPSKGQAPPAPKQRVEKPLSFAEQVKRMRGKRVG